MAQSRDGRQSFPAGESDRRQRLDVFLAARVPSLTRSRIQQLIEQGKAGIESGSASFKPSFKLRGGERVWIEPEPPPPLQAVPEAIPLEILYEDEDVAAINKPAGMVVHLGAGVRGGTLVNALLHRWGSLSRTGGASRPGIVHRLDRNTSGVLLVAKNDLAHQALAKQFADRSVEKLYTALVHGRVAAERGEIALAIGRDRVRRQRMTTRRRAGPGVRRALSRYPHHPQVSRLHAAGSGNPDRAHASGAGASGEPGSSRGGRYAVRGAGEAAEKPDPGGGADAAATVPTRDAHRVPASQHREAGAG